jgi:hypothetical protein
MHPDLKAFVRQLLGVVVAALLPVIAVSFLSMPLSLSGHPGEPRPVTGQTVFHLT